MAACPIGSASGFGDLADFLRPDFFPDLFLDDGLFDGLLLLLLARDVELFAEPDFAEPLT